MLMSSPFCYKMLQLKRCYRSKVYKCLLLFDFWLFLYVSGCYCYHGSPKGLPGPNAPKQCRISSQSQASTKVVQGSHQFSAEYLRRTRVHQSSARPAAVGNCYKLFQGSHVGTSFAREYMRRTRDVNVTIVPI